MDIGTSFELVNGIKIPIYGLGVFKSLGDEARNAVSYALENEHRLIDTAAFYENEAEVAKGIADSGIKREDVFVTSKVWVDNMGYDETMKAFDATMDKLGFDYLDMYMMHWPIKGMVYETWKAIEDLYQQKKIRVVGACNIPLHLLKEMKEKVRVMPMVNQVQYHPWLFNTQLRDWCIQEGILLQAWAPLGRGYPLNDECVINIAKEKEKTPAQVVLRWGVQQGVGIIPKSSKPHRIIENADIFDFELTSEEMDAIYALHKGEENGGDVTSRRPENIIT